MKVDPRWSNRAETLGYNQWVQLRIMNYSYIYGHPGKSNTHPIKIKNVSLSYGKFHQFNSKDVEIPASQFENSEIRPGGDIDMFSCGRSGSPSGTTGSFSLFDMTSGTKICTVNWDCPWASSKNSIVVSLSDSNWTVKLQGFVTNGAALGFGTINCYRVNKP